MSANESGPSPVRGERLVDVEQAARRPVEPVLGVAGAGQPAADLQLGRAAVAERRAADQRG